MVELSTHMLLKPLQVKLRVEALRHMSDTVRLCSVVDLQAAVLRGISCTAHRINLSAEHMSYVLVLRRYLVHLVR